MLIELNEWNWIHDVADFWKLCLIDLIGLIGFIDSPVFFNTSKIFINSWLKPKWKKKTFYVINGKLKIKEL